MRMKRLNAAAPEQGKSGKLPLEEMIAGSVEATAKIGEYLRSRGCVEGHILIHRTNEEATKSILRNGLNTNVKADLALDYSVTVHRSASDRHFSILLLMRHRSSTHHLVFFAPSAALHAFGKKLEDEGLSCSQTLDKLAFSMGGVIPRKWLAGIYLPDIAVFKAIRGSDFTHIPDMPEFPRLAEQIRNGSLPADF